MATKAQAKTAIDNAGTGAKSDIDNILPVGVNILDGRIDFAPTRYSFTLDAGGVVATADSWLSSLDTALTTAGRVHTIEKLRRIADGTREYRVTSVLAVYRITNF